MGKTSYRTVVRDCINTYEPDGCNKEVNVAKQILNGFIKVVNDMPLVDVTVDANVCYCSTPLCVAGDCGDGQLKIMDYW